MIIWRDEAMQFHSDAKPPWLHDLLHKTDPTQHGRYIPFGRQGREMYLGNILQDWKSLRHKSASTFYFLLQSQALSWVWLWERVAVKRIRSAFRFASRKTNQQQSVVTEHCNQARWKLKPRWNSLNLRSLQYQTTSYFCSLSRDCC